MKYRIFGSGWPVGSHLIPTGTTIDTNIDTWAAGITPPPNCQALDDEAAQLLQEIYGAPPQWSSPAIPDYGEWLPPSNEAANSERSN
jgi:hypothetical protein